MKKRLLTTIPVLLVVFLCSFPAYAVTGGGKTIVSNSYSYNNGDVTVYVRVNGQAAEELYEGQHYYPHNFTVTIANNTNEFQVADANNFSIDLYSGSATAFASNQNSWGAEVTSYSDNMTVPRITMYPSGDLAGHVLVAFNDSDLLVLNPNETRTYNFSINFIQTENINYTPLNGNFRYSYFTYTGSVGFYARPSSFTENTIEDFINNDSLPNSIISWLMAQYVQGTITNQELNDLIHAIIYSGTYPSISGSAASNTYYQINDNGVRVTVNRCIGHSIIIDNIFETNSDTDTYFNSYSINIPINYFIIIQNTNDVDVQLQINNAAYDAYLSIAGMPESYIIDQLYGEPALFFNYSRAITIRNISIPAKSSIVLQVYGHCNVISSNPDYSISFSNNVTLNGHFNTYDPYNSFNVLEQDAHNQEMNYYSQTNTALSNTGLSNFSFSPNVIGGLGVAKDHFTYIWNKLGVYKDVYLFSMTLAIALMIIRHVRPIRRKKEE